MCGCAISLYSPPLPLAPRLASLVPATRIFPPTEFVGGNIRVAGTRLPAGPVPNLCTSFCNDRAAGSGAAVAAPQFLISHASDNMSHTFYCRSKKVVLAHVLAKRPN